MQPLPGTGLGLPDLKNMQVLGKTCFKGVWMTLCHGKKGGAWLQPVESINKPSQVENVLH